MTDDTHADCYDEDEVHELRLEVEAQHAVIARLLDGWCPTGVPGSLRWRHSTTPTQFDDFEPMSDGEAAIIRAHQEQE